MSNPTEQFDLFQEISDSENLANWIFWDNFYDCDGRSEERTVTRLNLIEGEHGEQTVWGICANWAQYLFGTLVQHYACIEQEMPPVAEILSSEKYTGDSKEARAARSVVQFVSAMSYDDLEMSRAIFLAAHNASIEDADTFVFIALKAFIRVMQEFDHGH